MLGDRSLAEETAQDVFVRIWKALPGYRADASLSTWIYAITRNAEFSFYNTTRSSSDLHSNNPSEGEAARLKWWLVGPLPYGSVAR
jgi:DNA-directed RNA polymerase specialized sigma24 family protein